MNRVVQILLGVFVIIVGIAAYLSIFTVHQTQQALILAFGKPVGVQRDPGFDFKAPWHSVTFFDRRILDLDPPPQEVILSDQKRINVDSFARYRIVDPLKFRERALTDSNFRQIFGAQLNSSVRAEVGKVLLADMLSDKRDNVMNQITTKLKEQAPTFGIEVIDVRIGRTDLPETTSQSVYDRMRSSRVAQAKRLRAEGAEIKARIQANADRERTIIIATANRQAQILRGEGEGEKTRILNKAFTQDADFFSFYRTMEAYGVALGDDTTMVLSPDSEFFRFFRSIQGTKGSQR